MSSQAKRPCRSTLSTSLGVSATILAALTLMFLPGCGGGDGGGGGVVGPNIQAPPIQEGWYEGSLTETSTCTAEANTCSIQGNLCRSDGSLDEAAELSCPFEVVGNELHIDCSVSYSMQCPSGTNEVRAHLSGTVTIEGDQISGDYSFRADVSGACPLSADEQNGLCFSTSFSARRTGDLRGDCADESQALNFECASDSFEFKRASGDSFDHHQVVLRAILHQAFLQSSTRID